MKFAIIEAGVKQYKISPGQKIKINKLSAEAGSPVVFDKVLLVSQKDGEAEVGAPYLGSPKISAKVIRHGRERKKIVFKYHSKTRYRKKKGHRQDFTEVEIENTN